MSTAPDTFAIQARADIELSSLIATYLRSSSLRPEILFSHFLPTGYRQTTLTSVPGSSLEATVLAKVHLGMMITLFDDFADHPLHRNPRLLSSLYELNIDQDLEAPLHLTRAERATFALARFLFSSLTQILRQFPHYQTLLPALRFDVEQFYSANRHSELIFALPSIANVTESRLMGGHNMGIVAAGTIDLMASPSIELQELGACREIFHLGQRLGRISNLIFTLRREIAEGDATNEIWIARQSVDQTVASYEAQLLNEFPKLLEEIGTRRLRTFDISCYASGFVALHRLHATLSGQI